MQIDLENSDHFFTNSENNTKASEKEPHSATLKQSKDKDLQSLFVAADYNYHDNKMETPQMKKNNSEGANTHTTATPLGENNQI
jgi:hypothetical protein